MKRKRAIKLNMVESHPRVKAYVKNHNLGLEVPYRYGSETRTYIPDFIVLVDHQPTTRLRQAGGLGEQDPLHLIVEIKGYRREDAKEKKTTTEIYWVPGVNNMGSYGRWAFVEFTEVYQIDDPLKRLFYEVECINGNWSVRELKRQTGSLLYERAGLSRDKGTLLRLVNEQASPLSPQHIIRDPYVFEFLGFSPHHVLLEKGLEMPCLTICSTSFLNLGKGSVSRLGRGG